MASPAKFRIDFSENGFLGSGAFGRAYICTSSRSGRKYCAKVIATQGLTDTAKLHAVNEADILRSLRHPSIIRYRASYLAESTFELHIITEFAVGGNLADRLQARRSYLPENQVKLWLRQLGSALKHIHSLRVLHRSVSSCTGEFCYGFLGGWTIGTVARRASTPCVALPARHGLLFLSSCVCPAHCVLLA